MTALALPALCFLQTLAGIFIAPFAMAYFDTPKPLDELIVQIKHQSVLPTDYVAFIGNEQYWVPSAVDFAPDDPRFPEQIIDYVKVNERRFGLVIIEADSGSHGIKLSQILDWGFKLLDKGGQLWVYDLKNDRAIMTVRKLN